MLLPVCKFIPLGKEGGLQGVYAVHRDCPKKNKGKGAFKGGDEHLQPRESRGVVGKRMLAASRTNHDKRENQAWFPRKVPREWSLKEEERPNQDSK